MAERDKNIDALKGFGIILVVVGHSIQTTYPAFDNELLFRIIYSFHMPFFMFIGGYLMTGVDAPTLVRRFGRLVVPFVAWYVMGALFASVSYQDYFTRIIKSVDYGLWFLWVLFLCYLVSYFAFKLTKYGGTTIAFLVVFLALRLIPYNFLGIGLLQWHYGFFAAGYLVSQFKQRLRYWHAFIIAFIITAACAYPIMVSHWTRLDDAPGKLAVRLWIQTYLTRHWWWLAMAGYDYLTAFLGITLVWFVVGLLKRNGWLAYLGSITVGIYASHFYLLGHGLGDGYVKVFTAALFAISASVAITLGIQQIPIARGLMLGIWPSNSKEAPARVSRRE